VCVSECVCVCVYVARNSVHMGMKRSNGHLREIQGFA